MNNTTKKQIADALDELTKIKSIDRITIKDITGRCQLSRQTFYYHFDDIYDVLEWMIKDKLNTIIETKRYSDPLEVLTTLISYSRKDHNIIQKMLNSPHHQKTEKILFDSMQPYFAKVFYQDNHDLAIKSIDLEIIIDFCTGGFISLMLKTGAKKDIDPKELAQEIKRLLSTVIKEFSQ